ncbi:MAG: hypothetical protein Q8T11_00295 [Elusimicrobiota bacterium]|nr:hypothetical protein [Elusimicrobiota bacterium]
MKHHTSFNLVLAATLVLPLSAKAEGAAVRNSEPSALTGEQAKTAAASAVDMAAENAERISSVPVEFAWVMMTLPYGSEEKAVKANGTKEDVEKAVIANRAHWKAVSAALIGERERLAQSLQSGEAPTEELLRVATLSTQIMRLSFVCDAIVADAEKDAALAKSIGVQETESRQELLKRKAGLFKTLGGLKKNEAAKPVQNGFYRQNLPAVDVLNLLPGPVMPYSPAQFQTSAEKEREHDLKIEQLRMEPVSVTIRRLGRIIQQPNDKK